LLQLVWRGCVLGYRSANQKGSAFYHMQEHDAMKESGELYIAYGTFLDPELEDEEDIVRIGHLVCSCLTSAGLQWDWDGDLKKKIRVLIDHSEPRPKLTVVPGTSNNNRKTSKRNPEETKSLKLVVSEPSSAPADTPDEEAGADAPV